MSTAVAYRTPATTEEPANDVSQPKALIDLKMRDCRWVCEEPTEANGNNWMYCGKRSKSETCAYCADHHKVMYDPPKIRVRKQNRL